MTEWPAATRNREKIQRDISRTQNNKTATGVAAIITTTQNNMTITTTITDKKNNSNYNSNYNRNLGHAWIPLTSYHFN
jgi:hypothetical protein